jgi:hypothetical protein
MANDDDELGEGERHALDAWTTLTPPAGFADRVMAAGYAKSGAPRKRWPWLVAGAAALGAAAAVLVVMARGGSQPASGELVAKERTTTALGERAVAVVEADAEIRWHIEGDGTSSIDQLAGDVFYRVDRGGPFVVHTPAGDVRVTGTCFRVEVPMNKKHVFISGSVGAALAAAVVVTVYEGHVIAETKTAKTELAAGTRATLDADGHTTTAAVRDSNIAVLDAQATREQLLARAATQRTQIAQLEARLADLERGNDRPSGDHSYTPGEPGRTWHDPSPEKLAQWAAECHVRVDSPSLDRFTPMKTLGKNPRGLEQSEMDGYNAAMTEMSKQWHDTVRALYLEATGDTAGADTLSTEAMRREIEEKSSREESGLILQRISAEKAGLAKPPADLSKTSPAERLMRAYLALGDQSEAALAKRLNAERARAIRGDAWDSRSDMSGCPDK